MSQSLPSGSLSGKTALVTGSSRGIGADTVRYFAEAGANVVINFRNKAPRAEKLATQLRELGVEALVVGADLTDPESVTAMFDEVQRTFGGLDILVLNAGMLGSLSSVPAIDPKEMAQVLTLNVSAQAALIAAFDPMLKKAKSARVIGVTSSVGRKPRAYWGLYGASKAAFETLLGAYGDEMAEISGIRTAIVDPGATRTKMRARAYPGEDPKSVKDPQIVADRIVALAIDGFEPGHFERVA